MTPLVFLVLHIFVSTSALPVPAWVTQISEAIFGSETASDTVQKCGIVYGSAECATISDIEFTTCDSDRECNGTATCCWNGCSKACAQLIVGPVIDYLVRPKHADGSRYLWLPGENTTDVSCSGNSLLGEDLYCPDSFWCLVTQIGDRENEIPARGICKPEEEAELFLTRVHIQ